MREQSRPILDAVDRHGELHLIIVGTLRVHPQWEPDEPYYGYDSTLAPRDTAAEGQLWMEEMALERAQAERPVSIIRASNAYKEFFSMVQKPMDYYINGRWNV